MWPVYIVVHGDCCREPKHLRNILAKSVKYRHENQEERGSQWNDIDPCANGRIGPIDDIAWQDPVTHKVQAYHLPNRPFGMNTITICCGAPCEKEGTYWFKVCVGCQSGADLIAGPQSGWYYPVVP